VSGTPIAEGITNPPIDELLTKTDSKYRLVLYAAKRARQINAYYSQLGEGLLEYVGPLVDTHVQEKPLSVALREINDDLLTYTEFDPEVEAAAGDITDGTPASDFAVDFGISLPEQDDEGAGPDGASAP
jgi:DNA-directed RNA polymerase subunit omega